MDNKFFMRQGQSRVLHIQLQQLPKRESQRPRFKLFDETQQSFFNRKNTRSSMRSSSSDKMSKTGKAFYQRIQTPSRQRKRYSQAKTSLSFSTIIDKPRLPIPIRTQSCFQFSTKTKPGSKRDEATMKLYQQISNHNKKLLSKVFLFQGEGDDFPFKQQNTSKSYLQWLRMEEMKRRQQIKQGKDVSKFTKAKDIKGKRFNCIVAHKKRRQLEKRGHLEPWEALAQTEEVEI